MWKACSLVRDGKVSAEAFAEAAWLHYLSRLPLGELALRQGVLNMNQVFDILGESEMRNKPFGETAIDLGYMDEDQLSRLLMTQQKIATPVEDILVQMGAWVRPVNEYESVHTKDCGVTRQSRNVELNKQFVLGAEPAPLT